MLYFYFVIGLQVGYILFVFNNFVRHRQAIAEASSAVLVQLQRRNDLLIELLPVIKATKQHEAAALHAITAMHSHLSDQFDPHTATHDGLIMAEGIHNILTAEAHPKLKVQENYRSLMYQLKQLEDDIQGARLLFNQACQRYNLLVSSFPSLLIARTFGFQQAAFFELPPIQAIQAEAVKTGQAGSKVLP
jgi:LemA protein